MTSDMGTYDENLCIRRIADDDSEAFGMLFRHYYPKTVILLNALTKDGTVSEDLAQDIFLKIWMSRSMLPELRDFGAWLYVTARNAALMHLRKKKPSTSTEDLEILIDGFIEEQCEAVLKKRLDTRGRREDACPEKGNLHTQQGTRTVQCGNSQETGHQQENSGEPSESGIERNQGRPRHIDFFHLTVGGAAFPAHLYHERLKPQD